MLPGGSLCLTPARIGDAGVRGEERGYGEAEIPVKMLQRAGIFFFFSCKPRQGKAETVFCLPSYGPGVREEMRHSRRDRQPCDRLGWEAWISFRDTFLPRTLRQNGYSGHR